MAAKNVIIVGGHGKISMRLARLLAPKHSVTSIIRTPDHESDILSLPASPLLLSLEESSIAEFATAFSGKDLVYFSAGAGGKGGPERTKKVDYEGALKVFDAIEKVEGKKPRLILVSAIDARDLNADVPKHYNDDDIAASKRTHSAIGNYMHWKFEADKNLALRTGFKWTIVRPGSLTDGPGAGTADIGRTHITKSIARDDVAKLLELLAEREDAAGLVLDIVGGDVPISESLDKAIKNGESDGVSTA